MQSLSHLDEKGQVKMVDVTAKDASVRWALAEGTVSMQEQTFEKIMDFSVAKGNVLETARIAGIMGAKKTWDLIPLCHPLDLSHVAVNFFPDAATHTIRIEAEARLTGRTGVEMEALTAVAVAGLTIYDMCKAVDRTMTIGNIRLLKKTGGRSGDIVAGA